MYSRPSGRPNPTRMQPACTSSRRARLGENAPGLLDAPSRIDPVGARVIARGAGRARRAPSLMGRQAGVVAPRLVLPAVLFRVHRELEHAPDANATRTLRLAHSARAAVVRAERARVLLEEL